MAVVATYKATHLSVNDEGKFIYSFDRQDGQGVEMMLLVGEAQNTYALGSLFSLTLAAAQPNIKPVAKPALVPQQVPNATPQAVPQQVPQPFQVPQQTPYPTPQPIYGATPHLVPQPQQAPYQVPFATPQATPQQVPQLAYVTPPPMLPHATPYLVPDRIDIRAEEMKAYAAARGEAAAHAQMQKELDEQMAAFAKEVKDNFKPGADLNALIDNTLAKQTKFKEGVL